MHKTSLRLTLATCVSILVAGIGGAAPFSTGGAVTTDGAFVIHTFNSGGTLTMSNDITVAALVVAGGGGGGLNAGGGGGGGGVIYNDSYAITGGTYAVTVGAGGAGATAATASGSKGGDSIFATITAKGGGGGGSGGGGGGGGAGGSGGGGAGSDISGRRTAGTGTSGQGLNGGNGQNAGSNSQAGGGGGGGATGAGTVGASGKGGNGGNGLANAISGSVVYYGGGGGAGKRRTATAGSGGSGGGGDGDYGTVNHGAANSGGGGGGGSIDTPSGGKGGNGGKGVVIVRYQLPLSVLGGDNVLVAPGLAITAANGTYFGPAMTNAAAVDRTFVITNTSAAAITMTGAPFVTLFGDVGEFTVLTQPSGAEVPPNGSASFSIRFTPVTFGPRSAVVVIASDCATIPAYEFDIAGFGDSGAQVTVLGVDGAPIDTGAPASAAAGTDFGWRSLIEPVDVTNIFTIVNIGTHALLLDDLVVDGSDAFSVVAPLPVTPLAPSGSTTFGVRFHPIAGGACAAMVAITNNSYHSPHTFALAATVEGVRFVAPAGDDGNDGLSWATAKKTVQAGVDDAVAGDLVIVSNGTYNTTSEILVSKAIAVRGLGGAAHTVINAGNVAGRRVLRVTHKDATIAGLTLRGGRYDNFTEGGGVYLTSGVVSNCIIRNNSSYRSGGVYMSGGQLAACAIFGNTANGTEGRGGGVRINGGVMSHCVVSNNIAYLSGRSTWGDGVYVDGGLVRNCLIVRNGRVESNSQGGGVYMASGAVDFTTIAANVAGVSGGGVYRAGGTITNSVIALNSASSASDANTAAGFSYCVSPALTGGERGNISGTPLFRDPVTGNYTHRSLDSPGVNAGWLQAWMRTAADIVGQRRVVGGAPDMGCHELQASPGTMVLLR